MQLYLFCVPLIRSIQRSGSRAVPEPRTPVSSKLHPYPVEFIAAILIPTTTIVDPSARQVNVCELLDDRSFAGLPILELDVGDERRSALGIGFKSTTVAAIGKSFRIDVCANVGPISGLNISGVATRRQPGRR